MTASAARTKRLCCCQQVFVLLDKEMTTSGVVDPQECTHFNAFETSIPLESWWLWIFLGNCTIWPWSCFHHHHSSRTVLAKDKLTQWLELLSWLKRIFSVFFIPTAFRLVCKVYAQWLQSKRAKLSLPRWLQSSSTHAQYVALQQYFLHPRLVIYFFQISSYIGIAKGERLLITTHLD
jgi:hypothetical protein